MINEKDEKILEYVKDGLQECVKYLNENSFKIEGILCRYADLQIDIYEMTKAQYSMPDRYDEFPGMFVTDFLNKECSFNILIDTLRGLSEEHLTISLKNDLDLYCYDNVDAQIRALEGVISSLESLLDNDEVLYNLQCLVNKEFDYDEIICCFEGDEQVIVEEVEGLFSNFEGHGKCQLWNAYYNDETSPIYSIWVAKDDIIADVN